MSSDFHSVAIRPPWGAFDGSEQWYASRKLLLIFSIDLLIRSLRSTTFEEKDVNK